MSRAQMQTSTTEDGVRVNLPEPGATPRYMRITDFARYSGIPLGSLRQMALWGSTGPYADCFKRIGRGIYCEVAKFEARVDELQDQPGHTLTGERRV